MSLVPVTEEQKKSPLYAYYELEPEPVPPELLERIMTETFDDGDVLLFENKNQLFDDGYLPGEFGVFRLPEGGYSIANLTQMPGVTPDMFDWWFAWHGLDPLRYTIWDRDDHYRALTRNPEIALDASRPMRERYWHTTHDVTESLMGEDEPQTAALTFLPPVEYGFDAERYAAFDGTIVCTRGMCHFLRPVGGGSELRTRFWFDIPGFTEMAARAFLAHNVKEFTHLARILPELYGKYKDRFEPF